MAKDKLKKFAAIQAFDNVFEPSYSETLETVYPLKGYWGEKVFKNNNPIILELGCGKGEYTIGQAEKHPEKNFIGVDIKGNRIWRGAKTANDNDMKNVAFLRTRIELISNFFAENEVSEIWITFPDPQKENRRAKKRLTSSRFLNDYKDFLKKDGIVHLKTDSDLLHEYTKQVIDQNNLEVISCTNDLYNSNLADDILSIKTYYEQRYLDKGENITYVSYKLTNTKPCEEPPEEE